MTAWTAYAWAHKAKDAMARFLSHTREGEPPAHRPELGPCLIWTGARTRGGGKNGRAAPYGSFRVDRWHVVRCGVFVCVAGEKMIPGWHCDHACRNTLCVRLDHLEVITPAENSRRRWDGRRKSDRVAA